MTDDVLTPERFQEALYRLPDEECGTQLRDFTVTVAGPERWDSEAPYTYVVRADTAQRAWVRALAWHLLHEEVLDAYVVASESRQGVPSRDIEWAWNDVRPAQEQAATRELLLSHARELSARFAADTERYRGSDGDVDPKDYAKFDELRATYGKDALDLVQALAALGSDALETTSTTRSSMGAGSLEVTPSPIDGRATTTSAPPPQATDRDTDAGVSR